MAVFAFTAAIAVLLVATLNAWLPLAQQLMAVTQVTPSKRLSVATMLELATTDQALPL